MVARVHVLGTVQDGGFPHAGCACVACSSARESPAQRRRVACIGVEGVTGRTLLVDATPDLIEQVAALTRAVGGERHVPDAIALSHAHLGHYLGLAYLGREAMDAKGQPVHCTQKMAAFLKANRPWSHLVERGQITLHAIRPGEPLAFDGVTVRAFLSPHRAEDTDTLGFEVEGPKRTLVYMSDADVLPPPLVERAAAADVALMDGTFYSRDELPHRDILAVRHPFVKDTLAVLADARGEVWYTHLNHTNPLLHPDPARRPKLPPRFGVAHEGQTFAL
jgi:pyrroloquinoline quinone biosynthesis protein B